MNVEQLRRALADLPGDMPVVVEDCTTGWMENVAMYVAPPTLTAASRATICTLAIGMMPTTATRS